MAEVTILQVVPRLDAGGSEQAAVEIAAALARAGARALVATEGGRMTTALADASGEMVPLPMASKSPFTLLGNARRLAELIEARKVDLVHARSRAPAWSALIANSEYTARLIAARHGTPRDRIRVIYRGTDPAQFAPEAVNEQRLARFRAAWSVRDGQAVV